MTRPLPALLTLLLVVSTAAPAVASTAGSPDLSVHLPDNRVVAGEETALELFLLNGGNVTEGGSRDDEVRVTTARNVTVAVRSGQAPIEVRTSTQPVGSVPEGRVGPILFAISVAEDAAPGRYEVPVRVAYNYTSKIDTSDPRNPTHEPKHRTFERTVTLVVEERARFAVVNATTDAYLGETGDVTVTLQNVGTETATDARVTLRSADPALTFGGTTTAGVFVGDWAPGEVRTVTVSGRIAAGTGQRALPVVATVAFEDGDGTSRSSEGLQAGITPVAGTSRFPLVNATADVAVGERGTVVLRLTNAGDTPVTDATLTVRSGDSALTFGGSPTASVFAGEWTPGEVRTFVLAASIPPGADARPYPVSVTVEYRTAAGETRRSSAATTGVTPRTEQSFALANVTSTLAVGAEGTLRGTVTNTGETRVRNAVVVFSTGNANVVPVETEYAVGDLAAGESATFTFDAEVTDSADAGPRQLSLVVRYRDTDDDVRRSDPLDARVEVGPRQDVFSVEPVSATFDAGAAAVLELRVTNTGEEPVTDVSAKLFTDDPLSSSDDEAFIDRLGPGDSTTIRFALTAAGDALAKVYPVSIDFQYDDAEGDTRLSDSHDVPVEVVETQEADGPPVAVIGGAAAVLVVLVGGLWYWRRR